MCTINKFDVIAILSTWGIIVWMIMNIFGDAFNDFDSYGIIILIIVLLYLFSIINTIVSIVKYGFKNNKIKIISHSLTILCISFICLYTSEQFKSRIVLTASLKDDLYLYTLVFREDGSCENNIIGVFLYKETIQGNYYLKGDTIIFTKTPYVNNFIPDTVLLDKKENAIFLKRDSTGHFIKEKNYLNLFKILEVQ